ncbi:MAG: PSD1 and planctomycete cytochrome C domain-containing protein [Acidobacteriota bacterium]|nr:PSD1 and planctomycete cytochrome C domain-containing protein [Acidobacteriota bacterium]
MLLRLVAFSLAFHSAALAQRVEDQVRKILAGNCISCHGSAPMSGLSLRTRASILAGGTRGAAVVPGKASESILYQAVAREGKLQMPPGKKALSQEQVSLIREWIDAGAPFADAPAAPEPSWWAFKKPVRPSAKSIDELIKPDAQPADRRTLIRRATFDLIGLPPTPEEVSAFVNDPDPRAYEKMIDRLLASPHYGERWGRLWLDVARYADTGGYETDVLFPNAWRYRDYVIKSFNEDKPYDVFIKEQIAADEIWPDNLDLDGSYDLPAAKRKNLERRIGTSLYTLGAMPVEYSFFGNQYRAEWQAECANVTGAAFLGLTVQCARCHDHKFDPISQRDYYRLSAIFAGSEDREVPIVSQMRIFEYTRYETKIWTVEELRKKYNRLKQDDKDGRETVLREIGDAYVKAPVMYDKANLLVHAEPVPGTYVLPRGDAMRKGEKVKPGFPAALGAAPEIAEPDSPWFIPSRRKALAEWLASRDHPLTARVMVNRIWQGHFGRGIVATANDFGHQGEPPANQPLLDFLAVEFMDRGWSVKQMHRAIMNSEAYKAQRKPRRLDAESIRDSVLAAAGTLNTKMYGPPVVTALSEDERGAMRELTMWPVTSDASEHDRRSIYLFVKRSFRLPILDTFDAPDSTESCPRREASTVAPQALSLMNSEWTNRQAERFAARLEKSKDVVGDAWTLALARPPDDAERAKAQEYLAHNQNNLQRLCLLLFNMSEFLYVN